MSKTGTGASDTTQENWLRLLSETRGTRKRSVSAAKQIRQEKQALKKVDGRSLNKTGRTQQLNVRLKASTKRDIQRLAKAEGWLIGEAIEQAVAALVEKLEHQKRQ